MLSGDCVSLAVSDSLPKSACRWQKGLGPELALLLNSLMRVASSVTSLRRFRFPASAFACFCFGVFLRLFLLLSLSGSFTTVHFILVPHHWCAAHHQLEHLDGLPGAQRVHGNTSGSAIDAGSDGARVEHDKCSVSLSCPSVCVIEPLIARLALLPVSLVVSPRLIFAFPQQCQISLAPKRSPPSALSIQS